MTSLPSLKGSDKVIVSHRISVLGKDIQVKHSAPPEAVREIEAFVNARIAEVAAAVKSGDSQVVAILALMNIAEDYLAASKENATYRHLAQERVPRLLQQINERLV